MNRDITTTTRENNNLGNKESKNVYTTFTLKRGTSRFLPNKTCPRARSQSIIGSRFTSKKVSEKNVSESGKKIFDPLNSLSDKDREFRLACLSAYKFKNQEALDKYLSCYVHECSREESKALLKKIAQFFAGNEPLLAEWVCNYLIAKGKLILWREDIINYSFIGQVLLQIYRWDKLSLMDKYVSICNKQTVDNPLFGNFIVSSLHEIIKSLDSNKEISTKLKKFPLEISKVSKTTVNGIDCIAIVDKNISGSKSLLIFSPSQVSQERSSGGYYIADLIERFLINQSKGEIQQIVYDTKALFLLRDSKGIVIIEILISKTAQKIVIYNADSILNSKVINEIRDIARRKEHINVSVISDTIKDNLFRACFFIRTNLNEFFQVDSKNIQESMLIARSTPEVIGSSEDGVQPSKYVPDISVLASSNVKEINSDKIENNLNDKRQGDYLSALFCSEIPWDIDQIIFWKKFFENSEENSNLLGNIDSIKIAQDISDWIKFIQVENTKILAKISNPGILLVKFYLNLLDEYINSKIITSTRVLYTFFAKKKKLDPLDSFKPIHHFLLSNRFAEKTDLRSLFYKLMEPKSFSDEHKGFVISYNACVNFISLNDLLPRKSI